MNNYRKWLPLPWGWRQIGRWWYNSSPEARAIWQKLEFTVTTASRSSCYRGRGWLMGSGASVEMQPILRCHLKQKSGGINTVLLSFSSPSSLAEHTRSQNAKEPGNTILSETQQSKERVGNRFQSKWQITGTYFDCLTTFLWIHLCVEWYHEMDCLLCGLHMIQEGEDHNWVPSLK